MQLERVPVPPPCDSGDSSCVCVCVQCCDLGYHASLHRALRTYLSAEQNVETSKHTGLETLEGAAESLEPNGDKQKLMETYNNIFCPPARFDFQSHMGDTVWWRASLSDGRSVVHAEHWGLCVCVCVDGSDVCTAAAGRRLAPEVSAAPVPPVNTQNRE